MCLSRDELELIFDFCMGVATSKQRESCLELIAGNPEAADFCDTVQQSLKPLSTWQADVCPDDLVEKTIARVNQHAKASQQKLESLISQHKEAPSAERSTIWFNLVKRLAVAATFMIVALAGLTGLRYAKYKIWQIQCQQQLARIGQGMTNYSADNNGRLPAVATIAGAPWWKVGDQGKENVSNTRHIWLLPKGRYVKPSDFICPGVRKASASAVSMDQATKLNDFPARSNISYSFRLICDQPPQMSELPNCIIISDMNPLFEKLPSDFNTSLKLRLSDELLNANSNNHRRKGQNILFGDGRVKFIKTRKADISNDDIFTIQKVPVYQGVETPTCAADVFLAP